MMVHLSMVLLLQILMEMVIHKRNIVIDNGILKNIFMTIFMQKYGIESTGNAERNYNSLPSIGITNFIIEGEPLEGIQEGFIINELRGAHTANPISGDFSVEISSGFYISNEEKQHPIKHGMMVGNIFEFLNKVKGIYGQVKNTGGIITPSIISEARVVG